MTAPGRPNSPEREAWRREQLVRALIAHARNVVWARRGNGEHMDEAEYGDSIVKLLDAAKAVEDALAPPPEDPRVEAIRQTLKNLSCEGVEVGTRWRAPSDGAIDDYARRIIAALDAARAESRAKAQERRVQAMRQEIRRMLDALHAGAWMDVPKLADDFLAAADAAEARDG